MPAIKSHTTPTADTSWDGPKAVADAPGDVKVLEYMHAWWSTDAAGAGGHQPPDGDADDQKSEYKFPHHRPGTDTAANLNGCRNGLARLANSSIPGGDKAGVEAHLNRHLKDGGGGAANALAISGRQGREEAYEGKRNGRTAETARMVPFRGFLERADVLVNGKAMSQVDGYASVTGVEYEMWDIFGPYGETIDARAFDVTLAANPDVAFLDNHRGMTMARTTNGTLSLDADPRGLHSRAFLNPDRTDVRDLLIAIDDKVITEMSFAFMLVDGEWDELFEHFTITQVDIDRGDVSAVNYGANPYTSIGARCHQVMADLAVMPPAAQRAAYDMLSRRFSPSLTAPTTAAVRAAVGMDTDDTADGPAPRVERVRHGMSTRYVEQMLSLD